MKLFLIKQIFIRILVSLLIALSIEGPRPPQQSFNFVAYAAEPLSQARTHFRQGDIVAAKNKLEKEAKRMRGRDKEEALKILGVAYFLLGQKRDAKNAFEDAIAENPNAVIEKSYLLDPSIADFFNDIKKSAPHSKQRKTSQSAQRKSHSSKGSTANVGAIPPARPGATGILVKSNANGSTVFANGLFIGTAGQFIELSPGKYQVTVSAAGFNPASQNIALGKGQQLQLNVTLQDPEQIRRQELIAKRELRKKQLAEQARQEKKRKEEEARARAIAKAQAEQRAKAILQQEMAQKAEEAARRQEEARRSALALAKQERSQTNRDKNKQQNSGGDAITYNEKLPAGKHSLADEFRKDQKQAPLPAVQYPQQAQQRQPIPGPYQVPQQGFQNPAQVFPYQQPQRYPVPLAPYNQPYTQPAPQVYNTQRRKSKSTFLAFMPLGIGQFQNDDYLLGTISAATQAGLLGFGIYSYTLVSSARSAFEDEQRTNPNDVPQDYIDETDAYIAQWTTAYQLGFIGFAVVWIASGIEALVSINSNHAAQGGIAQHGKSFSHAEPALANNTNSERLTQLSFKPIMSADPNTKKQRFSLELQLKY